MFQAYSCDGITGATIDRLAVSSFQWEQLLSAGGEGTARLPLDDTYTIPQLRQLTQHWSNLLALEYNGRLLYMGYVYDYDYELATDELVLKLTDLWAMLDSRGAWDHSHPNVEKWSVTKTASIHQHTSDAIIRARDTGPARPRMEWPLTIPGVPQDTPVKKTSYGYHLQMVGDVLQEAIDEGLDIFFEPRWIRNGDTDWLTHMDIGWGTGRTHEFYVTSPMSAVFNFKERSDGSRITNNARRVGEGSEQDMLVRSNRNTDSPYPLRDRVTPSKHVKDVDTLRRQVNADLAAYGAPTTEWEFQVHINQGVRVGDIVLLHFYGNRWITNGWHRRRVVRISGQMDEFLTVVLQPTGGD